MAFLLFVRHQHGAVDTNLTTDDDNDNNKTPEKFQISRITQLDQRLDAIESKLSQRNDDNEDYTDNISKSISGYQESKNQIANLELEMDRQYGTRLRQGLRRQRQQSTISSKFKGIETAKLEGDTNVTHHKPLSLRNYANVYSAIHHTGLSKK